MKLAVLLFLVVVATWLAWLFWLAGPVAKQAMRFTRVDVVQGSPPATVRAAASAASSTSNSKIAAETSAQEQARSVTMADLGQAGDMFGGLNALFAGLAFMGVALAAWLQRGTLLAQSKQLKAAHDQQRLAEFEPLFFQLLGIFRQLQAGAVVRIGTGKSDFALNAVHLQGYVRIIARQAIQNSPDTPGAALLIKQAYEAFYVPNEQVLGPLFRTLYHAFRLVAESGLSDKQQVRYANIARGLLGGEFLLLLMLNCLSEYGVGFKPYVELFGLLKHRKTHGADDGEIDNRVAELFFEKSARLNYVERLDFWTRNPRPRLPI